MTRALLLGLLLPGSIVFGSGTSDLKRDQEVVFFPSVGRCLDGTNWEIQVHGCVYEPDKRRVALALLREALALDHVHMTESENAIFTERARLFMVDHKGGKRIVAHIGGRDFDVGKSRADGHFFAVVRLSEAEAQGMTNGGSSLQAVLKKKDARVFTGEVELFGDTGVTVISDIDDTIKMTGVQDRKATLRRTFLEPFEPVPGMAEVYRAWAKDRNAQFCYISASPWQLFTPLTDFLRSNGFPAGVFYLKKFRWKDESFSSLFESPEKYKPAIIEPLLKEFPKRRFVLVGDSGERDPEIYAALAREHPQQIVRILIRDLGHENSESERFERAFHDLPPSLWLVFREPAEIKSVLR